MTLREKRIVVLGGNSGIGLATAREIAQAYLYLMRQTYGTGQVLMVDGGGALV
ncbi:MAG: hypothetical protein WBZ39_08410 [Methylovirgula sp.]